MGFHNINWHAAPILQFPKKKKKDPCLMLRSSCRHPQPCCQSPCKIHMAASCFGDAITKFLKAALNNQVMEVSRVTIRQA